MQFATPGQANTVVVDAVAKANGSPLPPESVVSVYLRARDGVNIGKWFDPAGPPYWVDVEVAAGVAEFIGGSAWEIELPAVAWPYAGQYNLYAADLDLYAIPYTANIVCGLAGPLAELSTKITRHRP